MFSPMLVSLPSTRLSAASRESAMGSCLSASAAATSTVSVPPLSISEVLFLARFMTSTKLLLRLLVDYNVSCFETLCWLRVVSADLWHLLARVT